MCTVLQTWASGKVPSKAASLCPGRGHPQLLPLIDGSPDDTPPPSAGLCGF